MREIKFRAWHRGAEEFCEGLTSNMFQWREDGQPITLMQYTGLKDANGVEMYEGDVLTAQKGSYSGKSLPIKGALEVHGIHWFINTGDILTYLGGVRNIKVIGNIYENPELIRGDTK